MTLEQFSAHLNEAAVRCRPALELDLLTLGELTVRQAKHAIGTYEYEWPQLAQSTQEDRVKKGYPPNEPLLRTGHLRDSIHMAVADLVLAVGSNDKIAFWQETGTSRMPPRPFLSYSMLHSMPIAHELFGKTAVKLLTGVR